MKKQQKCYIYTRVSTSMQVEGYSLDAQKDKLRKYADYQEMSIVGEYSDEGKSGKSVEGRPQFKQMLADQMDHLFVSDKNYDKKQNDMQECLNKLYDKFTDLEKKTFLKSFLSDVFIYEEEQKNGETKRKA